MRAGRPGGWLAVGVVGSMVLTALLVFLLDVPLYPAWLAGTGLVVLLYYGWDKQRARAGGRRIPERTLHLLSLAGGVAGGWLGRAAFRHKTRKAAFLIVLIVATVLHGGALLWTAGG